MCVLVCLISQARTFIARESGIVPDKTEVCTAAIQHALDSLGHVGGGTLVFDSGTYITGAVRIPSHVTLRVDSGATVLGSINPYDYAGFAPEDTVPLRGLLWADDASSIAVCGEGIIDGRGLELALAVDSLHHTGERIDPGYNYRRMRPSLRPKLLDFYNVDSLTIEDIRLRGSAAWGCSLNKCSDVLIRNINFINRAYWNNDGIDVTDCRNVLIDGCYIDSADDGIVLKSFDPASGNDGITVRDCEIRSSASAFKTGTESFGAFRNVTVKNIRVRDTFRSAVALETVDGAIMENVTVDGVDALNTGNAVFVRLGHRHGDAPGAIRNVTIRNLRCEITFSRPDSEYDIRGPEISVIHNPFPSSITGIPGAPIDNIRLENIDVSFPGRGTKGMGYIGKYRLSAVPEAEKDYPEFHMFGELPAWGLYLRHINNIEFENVRFHCRESDYRDAIVSEDVTSMSGNVDIY